jgi:hypothetical protein
MISLGFDGSWNRDSSALVATEIRSGYQWPIDVWEHPGAGEWTIDFDAVDAAVEYAFARWRVVRMYVDPRYWESQIKAWQGRHTDKVVIAWPTNRPRPMAAALLGYRNAIVQGEQSHSGDEVLAQHVANAVRHREAFDDDQGNRMVTIRKERQDSPNKIDAAIAACLSWEARGDAIADGVLSSEDQGVQIFI